LPGIPSHHPDLDDIFTFSQAWDSAGKKGKKLTMAEVRNNWEGRIINGVFPLRRFLGSSGHSSVFLTESAVEGFFNAAIKIVPADPDHSSVHLWHWKTATTFSHPHLIRLLDCGQCELDGEQFLFVVMEYAEESLSQILPYRALAPDEVRELLVPTLDALAFLHRESWVQGQLKPSNFLVVNDQLKLATDTIRPVAVSRVGLAHPSIYEPPESAEGNVSAAGDVWALGVTLVEALTQYPPTWPDGRAGAPAYPANLPPIFAETVQRCLSRDPADRPTVAELQSQTKPIEVAPPPPTTSRSSTPPRPAARSQIVMPAPLPEPAIRAEPRQFSEFADEPKRGVLVPALVALLVVGGVVWGGSRLLRGHAKPEQTAETVAPETNVAPADASAPPPGAQARPSGAGPNEAASPEAVPPQPSAAAGAPHAQAAPPPPPPVSAPTVPASSGKSARSNSSPPPRVAATSRGQTSATGSSTVHEEIPTVPLSARATIRGHVRVGVRVTVDNTGRVVRDRLDSPGPSKYFNRVASEAARKWRFAAADDRGSREWLLRFEFGRDGTVVHAVGPRS
jgi:TonB family protein